MKFFLRLIQTAILAVPITAFAIPAQADLIIDATFDSSITSDPNAAVIESTIDTAVQTYENLFTNNITVSIYFQEGGGLGENEFYYNDVPYTEFYIGLTHNDANPAAIDALNANGGDAFTNGGVNPVTLTSEIEIKSANARALGIDIPPQCQLEAGASVPEQCGGTTGTAYDGIISLNTDITYPPQPNNGSNYGLLSTAEHEIDEVLGLGSALENCDPSNTNDTAGCQAGGDVDAANDSAFGNPLPEDLFRWNGSGGRTLSTNCATPTLAYFSYGPSTGNIAEFNNACNDADFGDWVTGSSPQTQDAYGTPGADPAIGPSEIDALTAIGYTLAPEPGTWVTLLTSLAFFAVARRRLSA